jgi:hypothetical protein
MLRAAATRQTFSLDDGAAAAAAAVGKNPLEYRIDTCYCYYVSCNHACNVFTVKELAPMRTYEWLAECYR